MEFDIVDKRKYPTYPKFGVGVYLFHNGINQFVSVVGIVYFFALPLLAIKFLDMPFFGSMIVYLALILFALFLIFSPFLLYKQKAVIKDGFFRVYLFNKLIREFSLNDINFITRVRRFNKAFEIRFNGNKTMFLFTDELPSGLNNLSKEQVAHK